MGSMSPVHWLILAVVLLVVFGGGGKISGMMGDFAKGIKSFKKNMADDESMTPSDPGTTPGHIAPPHQVPPGQSVNQNLNQNAGQPVGASDGHRPQA